MRRKVLLLVVTALAILATAIPALAAAPAEGTVIEGHSVPGGVALGDTRAQVETAYGAPASCQNLSYYDGRQGVDGICRFYVDGGGRVKMYFYAPDGGPAQGSADDEVSSITWEQGVSGWETTAGINTIMARDNPQAVLDAYPNAEVTYWYDGTFVAGVRDWGLGISVSRFWEFYCGCAVASISIFHPQDPPPAPEPVKYTYVAEIDMTAVKVKRDREITAQVLVNDAQDLPAEGATVSARWHLPDGSEQTVQAGSSSSGYATFTLSGRFERGTYYLFIDDVQLADHIWNYNRGLRHATVSVK